MYAISCTIPMSPLMKLYSTMKLRSNITTEPIQVAFKSGIYDFFIKLLIPCVCVDSNHAFILDNGI